VRALDCWNLADLDRARREGGIEAARAMIRAPRPAASGGVGGRPIAYPNGYRLSPYADVGPAPGLTRPPRRMWHASGGSSGPTVRPGA